MIPRHVAGALRSHANRRLLTYMPHTRHVNHINFTTVSTLVWPPVSDADLTKEVESTTARELEWLLSTLQDTLTSLKIRPRRMRRTARTDRTRLNTSTLITTKREPQRLHHPTGSEDRQRRYPAPPTLTTTSPRPTRFQTLPLIPALCASNRT